MNCCQKNYEKWSIKKYKTYLFMDTAIQIYRKKYYLRRKKGGHKCVECGKPCSNFLPKPYIHRQNVFVCSKCFDVSLEKIALKKRDLLKLELSKKKIDEA